MDNQLKLFDMAITQPEYVVKFGRTHHMYVENRFKDHILLKDYDLEITFSQKMTPEQADLVESEYLQKYPKILYDFDFNYNEPVNGQDEMRFIDKGVINKILSELYDRKENEWPSEFEENQLLHKFYFVTFFLKGSKSHTQWKKRSEDAERKAFFKKKKESERANKKK